MHADICADMNCLPLYFHLTAITSTAFVVSEAKTNFSHFPDLVDFKLIGIKKNDYLIQCLLFAFCDSEGTKARKCKI